MSFHSKNSKISTFYGTHGLTWCSEYKWLPVCGKEPLQFHILLIALFFLQPQYPNSPNLEAPFIASILIHSPNPEALIASFLHQTQIWVLPHVHTSTKTIQEHQKVENQHIFISKHKWRRQIYKWMRHKWMRHKWRRKIYKWMRHMLSKITILPSSLYFHNSKTPFFVFILTHPSLILVSYGWWELKMRTNPNNHPRHGTHHFWVMGDWNWVMGEWKHEIQTAPKCLND